MRLTKKDVAVLALWKLGGTTEAIDTEDAAIADAPQDRSSLAAQLHCLLDLAAIASIGPTWISTGTDNQIIQDTRDSRHHFRAAIDHYDFHFFAWCACRFTSETKAVILEDDCRRYGANAW